MCVGSSCGLLNEVLKEEDIDLKTESKVTLTNYSQKIIEVTTGDCVQIGGYEEDHGVHMVAIDTKTPYQISIILYVDISDVGKRIPVKSHSDGSHCTLFVTKTAISGVLDAWQVPEDERGHMVIRSFNKATGLASFDVNFEAVNVMPGGGQRAAFSGSFENVPIFSHFSLWQNCMMPNS